MGTTIKEPHPHLKVAGLKRRSCGLAVAMTLGLLFLFFVWPTPFVIVIRDKEVYRVNRFTGVQQRSTRGGWRTEEEVAQDRIRTNLENRPGIEKMVAFAQTEAKRIRPVPQRDEIPTITLENPTNLMFHGSTRNVQVDYYWENPETHRKEFLFSVTPEIGLLFFKPHTHQTLTLTALYDQAVERINALPACKLTQQISIEFNEVQGKGAFILPSELEEPITIKFERKWEHFLK